MSELSVAIVGCGAAGGVHLSCWVNLHGVRIDGVCDTNGAAAARSAATLQGAACFQDVGSLLKSHSFDIVDICTPASSQFEIARTALNAGANVLCETPFTSNGDQAQALAVIASERERVLAPNLCHRFHAPVLFARDAVESDELGRVTMFRCRFSGYWDDASTDHSEIEAGALRSTAIHAIDLFRYLCGDVSRVTGYLKSVNAELDVEDTAALLLEAESGALGVIETSWTSPGGRNILEIYGTAGSCIVDYDTGVLRYLTADQPVWRAREETGPNRFERSIASFADVVRGLQPPTVTAADAVAAARICDVVYAARA